MVPQSMGSVGKVRIGEVVGLWFRPRDDELINDHLKLHGLEEACRVIPELNIYSWEPQALFEKYDEMSDLPSDGRECFFYCTRNGKNRKTRTGSWKGIGKKHTIRGRDGEEIGFKNILVYHKGRQRCRRKSPFSMHEYHLNCRSKSTIGAYRRPTKEIVLCRIINRMVEMTIPDSPSSECIEPDPVTPGACVISNQGDDQASPQVCSQHNLTEAELGMPSNEQDDGEVELQKYYESLCDEKHLFTYNDRFRDVGGSSGTINYNDYGADNEGAFFSELWDLPKTPVS